MARYHCAKIWRAEFVYCLLLFLAKEARTVPNHGIQTFLGYEYWNNRYTMGYTDWNGFWNNGNNGRTMYNRQNSETSGQSCGGCSCNNQERTTTCTGPSV